MEDDELLGLEQEGFSSARRTSSRNRTMSVLKGRVIPFFESIGRFVGAAQELIADKELTKKGVAVVAQQARRGFRGVQQGIQNGIGLVQNLQKQVVTRISRQVQQLWLQALQEDYDDLVDIQLGHELLEHQPQEVRSRFWLAILALPLVVVAYREELVELRKQQKLRSRSRSRSITPVQADTQSGSEGPSAEECMNSTQDEEPADNTGAGFVVHQHQHLQEIRGTCSNTSAANETQQATTQPQDAVIGQSHSLTLKSTRESDASASDAGHLSPSGEPVHGLLDISNVGQLGRASSGDYSSSNHREDSVPVVSADLSEWEVIQEKLHCYDWEGKHLVMFSHLPFQSTTAERIRSELMSAMWAMDWPAPHSFVSDERYQTMLDIEEGQEEVDDTICRDIHRTFPEHPKFAEEDGRQSLRRVLYAYALHDIEVGYCQGMAFLAGVLLMYLDEEQAFSAFVRLLDPRGANLRRFYLPGMHGLKLELRIFEHLLEAYMPKLHGHLQNHGVVAVLYAAQWFLTSFSYPFRQSFASRVVDVMLVEGTSYMLQRTALAIMATLEPELVALDDFEDILTYVKVQPTQWDKNEDRIVLSAATYSPVTDDDIASIAVVAEAEGSAPPSRVTSTNKELLAPISRLARVSSNRAALRPAQPSASGQLKQAEPSAASSNQSADDLDTVPGDDDGNVPDADLAMQQAEIEDDYLNLLLAMDMMWPEHEAFDETNAGLDPPSGAQHARHGSKELI